MNPVVHFEMAYKDAKRVMEFYVKVFGWNMQLLGQEMSKYILAGTSELNAQGFPLKAGMINGGFYEAEAKSDSTTHVVISVEDINATIEQITAAGGKMTSAVMPIPGIGDYASFTDTEGNPVGVLQPAPMQ